MTTGSSPAHSPAPVLKKATRAPVRHLLGRLRLEPHANDGSRRQLGQLGRARHASPARGRRAAGGTGRAPRGRPPGRRRRTPSRPASTGGTHAPDPSRISVSTPSSVAAEPRALHHVRLERHAGERAAHAAAAHRRHAREHGVLEVVRRGVAARGGQRLEVLERHVGRRDHRLGRPAPPHRDDRGPAAALAQDPGEVARHGGLARPLAGADDGEHAAVEVELARSAAARTTRSASRTRARGGARARRAAASRPRPARARRPGRRRRSRPRREPPQRVLARLVRVELDPVVRDRVVQHLARHLLLAAAPHRADGGEPGDRVAHDRRVVLAVEQDDHPRHAQPCVVSPRSDGSFSYSCVRGSNEMIGSRSWNGYLRKTVTRSPVPPRSRCNRASSCRGRASSRRCPR